MRVIGLTGGIASGKSTISRHLKELGAVVIDADRVGHAIMKKGKPSWLKIKDFFGEDILTEDGEIDRKKLGAIVFKDHSKLEILNTFTHGYIVLKIKETIDKIHNKCNDKIVVVDAALLIEAGLYKIVDEVWLVVVDKELQLERLIDRDPLTSKEALGRIEAQMPTEEKLKYAHRIIDNTGDLEDTLKQVEEFWHRIKKENSGGR